jgi:hypothetical protein
MSRDSLREKAAIHATLALLVAGLVGLQLTYPEPALLCLAPALVLLAALAFDHYPGERLLAALARAWHPVIRHERRASDRPLFLRRFSPRGGALLAMALAGRGPPP